MYTNLRIVRSQNWLVPAIIGTEMEINMTLIQEIKDRLRLAKHMILAAFFSNVADGVESQKFSHYAQEFFTSPLFGDDDQRVLETAITMFPEKIWLDVLVEYVGKRRLVGDIELANFFVGRAEELVGGEDLTCVNGILEKAVACLSCITQGDTEASQTLADLQFIISHKFPGLNDEVKPQPTPPPPTETPKMVIDEVVVSLVEEEVTRDHPADPASPSRYDELKEFFQRGQLGNDVETKVFTELAREFAHEPRFATEGGIDILRSSIMANPEKFWVREIRGFVYRFQDVTLAQWYIGRLQTIEPTKKTLTDNDSTVWVIRGALAAQAGMGDLYGNDSVTRDDMSYFCSTVLRDFPGLPENMNRLLNAVRVKGVLFDKDTPEGRQPLLRRSKDVLTMNEYSSPRFPSAAEGAREKGDDRRRPDKPKGQPKKKKVGGMAPKIEEAFAELKRQRDAQAQRKAS